MFFRTLELYRADFLKVESKLHNHQLHNEIGSAKINMFDEMAHMFVSEQTAQLLLHNNNYIHTGNYDRD